jgi:aryl-alcohol dehydrogenase-like predicted oxidoreductase
MHTLGSCGLEVSALGLGCNNFGARLDEKGSIAVAEHVARARGGNRPVANQCD